jgi:hypothetical protein
MCRFPSFSRGNAEGSSALRADSNENGEDYEVRDRKNASLCNPGIVRFISNCKLNINYNCFAEFFAT